MDMPRPSADHKKLEKLAGTWTGTETMHPSEWDPKGGTADGKTVGRVALAGFAVVDYEQSRGGAATFQGHGVYTWDADRKQVVLHWFDSMGMGREEFRGTWSGDKLTLTSQGPMGHMRLTADHSTPGKLLSRMENSQDGSEWTAMFDGTYVRS